MDVGTGVWIRNDEDVWQAVNITSLKPLKVLPDVEDEEDDDEIEEIELKSSDEILLLCFKRFILFYISAGDKAAIRLNFSTLNFSEVGPSIREPAGFPLDSRTIPVFLSKFEELPSSRFSFFLVVITRT